MTKNEFIFYKESEEADSSAPSPDCKKNMSCPIVYISRTEEKDVLKDILSSEQP